MLWFLWRIGVPLCGLTLDGGLVWLIVHTWQSSEGNGIPSTLSLTVIIIAAMALVVLIVLLIEGCFSAAYRGALPTFMGLLGVAALFLVVAAVSDVVTSEDNFSELFGSINFYGVMLFIAIGIIAETLWIALIIEIQGFSEISLKCLICGGCLLGLVIAVTFIYWIAMMAAYFFARYYKIVLIVLGSALGGLYLTFLIIYCIVRRGVLLNIVRDNLDDYWRNAS